VKIRPVGAELSDADGRTDMTKLIVPFQNYANAPKSYRGSYRICYSRGRWYLPKTGQAT